MSTATKPTPCVNECVGDSVRRSHTPEVTKIKKHFKFVVGVRVKSLRSEAELTQEAEAERCGIFRTYLSRIEAGTANPTLIVLVALADSLGVDPYELLLTL